MAGSETPVKVYKREKCCFLCGFDFSNSGTNPIYKVSPEVAYFKKIKELFIGSLLEIPTSGSTFLSSSFPPSPSSLPFLQALAPRVGHKRILAAPNQLVVLRDKYYLSLVVLGATKMRRLTRLSMAVVIWVDLNNKIRLVQSHNATQERLWTRRLI